ncbi:hypothetical protein [Sulfoacidibacillus ferrooxidans]|nr:hypothetical protein [Sulfoacidibacillus ferrooxidans]
MNKHTQIELQEMIEVALQDGLPIELTIQQNTDNYVLCHGVPYYKNNCLFIGNRLIHFSDVVHVHRIK